MGDMTFRVLAALRELADETEDAPQTKEVATRAAVSISDAADRALVDCSGG